MKTEAKLKIAVLPGDGIGREVMAAARPVFDLLALPIELIDGEIGWECWRNSGDPIPRETWDLMERVDGVLLGAITSQPARKADMALRPELRDLGFRYVSPIIQLRQRLDLFANVRPVSGQSPTGKEFRFTVIRENTEGLYAGLDFSSADEGARAFLDGLRAMKQLPPVRGECTYAVRLLTAEGLERLFRFAFAHAVREGFGKVTLADKPNVLRASGQFAIDLFEKIASEYPHIEHDVQNADAVGLGLVRRPEQYGVIVAENMFGDLLSDVGAGVMGGLGLAPSANIGTRIPYFEPVHGSAPKYAGRGCANPMAMFLSIALLLKHFGFTYEANAIEQAVMGIKKEGAVRTLDLGGSASTQEMAAAILERIRSKAQVEAPKRTAAILATGEELIGGDVLNSTTRDLAAGLSEQGWRVIEHRVVGDHEPSIRRAIEELSAKAELVVVTGGLGPTSDDRTRFALADAVHRKLVFDEASWERIVKRLESFQLVAHDCNRQQALFPEGARILQNFNGTASGCLVQSAPGKGVLLLPGPPRESLPMFAQAAELIGSTEAKVWKKWLLLGAIEGEVGARVDQIAQGRATGFRLAYPYIEIKIQDPTPEMDAAIEAEFASCLVGDRFASEQVRALVAEGLSLEIEDRATGGALLAALTTPATRENLSKPRGSADLSLIIEGLDEFWRGGKTGRTIVRVGIRGEGDGHSAELSFPLRGPEVRSAAVEFACARLLKGVCHVG